MLMESFAKTPSSKIKINELDEVIKSSENKKNAFFEWNDVQIE